MILTPGPRIVVLSEQLTFLRGNLVDPVLPIWPPKDPTEQTTRAVDFAQLLYGRTITDVVYNADTVQIVSAKATGSVVNLVIAAGTDGTTARVEVRALCNDGTDEPAAVLLPVVSQIILIGGDTVPISQATTTNGLVGGILGPLPVFAAAGSSVNVSGTAIARNMGTGDTISYNIMLTAKNFGTGSAAIALANTTPFQIDAAMAGCTLTPIINGGFLMFAVVGLNATTIAWSCTVDVGVA